MRPAVFVSGLIDFGPLGLLIALLMALAWLAGSLGSWFRTPRTYFRKRFFISAAEKQFFDTLESVVGTHFRVFVKVRVADLIEVRAPRNGRRWWTAFARISQKHVDFCLVRRQAIDEVLLAIELDDRSHQRLDRRARDLLSNATFVEAGIPLIRFGLDYSRADVQRAVSGALEMLQESNGSLKVAKARDLTSRSG
jgi:hypothetical protein